jgi:hypothetical protein
MDSATVEDAVSDLFTCIEAFLDEFEDRKIDTERLTAVIENGDKLRGADIGQQPERFVEDHLIFPVLDALGYEFTPRPNSTSIGDEDEYPDFRVDNLTESVIGENKSINDAATAKTELRSYLNAEQHEYGFATDGFEWGVYGVDVDGTGDLNLIPVVPPQNLNPIVQQIARKRELVEYNDELAGETDPQSELARFYQKFGHHHIRTEVSGLTHFHDKYAELLAGEGEYGHDGIETALLNAIEAPAGADDETKLAFAALLVDRLAFVRLMKDRGVLDVRLHEKWEEHNQGLNYWSGSFVEKHLHPLFYDVLAMPPNDRDNSHEFGEPPHFAGGLFDPILPNEQAYDVDDEAMRDILTTFVEGEVRTVINEAVRGSLLQSYRASGETELVGEMAEWFDDLKQRYNAELSHVEENIKPTLRSFSEE